MKRLIVFESCAREFIFFKFSIKRKRIFFRDALEIHTKTGAQMIFKYLSDFLKHLCVIKNLNETQPEAGLEEEWENVGLLQHNQKVVICAVVISEKKRKEEGKKTQNLLKNIRNGK